MTDPNEHRIPQGEGDIYAREYGGRGPAVVLLHGFPDNGHIYDDLIPHLVAAGRRTVTIDFLGFGASDKPAQAHYSFPQQVGDVEAVMDALQIDRAVLVGHDAGGAAAVNFALRHPARAHRVVLLNAFYGDAPGLLVPELIELFSHPRLAALARHFLQSPEQFAWLLDWQRKLLLADAAPAGQARYQELLGPLIDNNFRQQPSAAPAFANMVAQFPTELASNTGRLIELRRSPVPFTLVWGRNDPYLHLSAAEFMRAQFRDGTLHALDAGHWPQIDAAADVARILLADEAA